MLSTEQQASRTKRKVPPRKGFDRKLISVSPEMARAIKEYRFRRRLENDTDAYRELLAKGLAAAEQEERGEREPKGKKR